MGTYGAYGIVALTADDLGDFGLPSPNHIKIDVDGLELGIVENMPKLLSNSSLRSIVIEISNKISKGRVEEKILSNGFKEVFREGVGLDIQNILFEKTI